MYLNALCSSSNHLRFLFILVVVVGTLLLVT